MITDIIHTSQNMLNFFLRPRHGLFYRGINGHMGGSGFLMKLRFLDCWKLSYVKRKECSYFRGAGKHKSKRTHEMC